MSVYANCLSELKTFIAAKNCAPLLVRLAWHDSCPYSVSQGQAGKGGANASIRFAPELKHGGNAGLDTAIGLIKPIKEKYESISWADFFQMASVAGIEVCGGPVIELKYGRVDATSEVDCPVEGRLPSGNAPFQQADGECPAKAAGDEKDPAGHLRRVFNRMGMDDKDIVVLSGAHTIGRVHPDRSGACPRSKSAYCEKGMSWTKDWLKFDNSYFTTLVKREEGIIDNELVTLETDLCLLKDPEFRKFALAYAKDQAVFFNDYTIAHKKLSEVGSVFK